MRTTKKKILMVSLLVISVLTSIFTSVFASAKIVPSDDGGENALSSNYYYTNLITTVNGTEQEYTLAKKFYQALEEMNQKGDFKDGVIEYDIGNIVTSEQLKAWVENGDLEVPKAFGAARDSFLMDHPELFYIDMYKVMISAGRTNGVYKGFIDSGREATVYRDDTFKSEKEVAEAITAYEAAVKKFADAAKAEVGGVSSVYKEDCALAISVNNQIAKNVNYDFSVYNDYLENGESSAASSSLAHTAYGALVNRKAVCSGYSAAYKAVLDYLNIPCVVVSGYSKGKDQDGKDTSGNVGHSWNYVRLQTAQKAVETDTAAARAGEESAYEWFAFDTTWNSVCKGNPKYSVMDVIATTKEHIASDVISSSGYALRYPHLSMLTYARAVNPELTDREVNVDGFKYRSVYTPFENTFDVKEYVSYNGKNAENLLTQDGLRLIMRHYAMIDGKKQWSEWQDIVNSTQYDGLGFINTDGETQAYVNNNVLYMQYAVVKALDPDKDVVAKNPYTGEVLFTWEKIYYSDAEAVEEHTVFVSDLFENAVYGTYTAAPYIDSTKSSPRFWQDYNLSDSMRESADSNIMADSKAISIKLVYDEPLHILDETKDIGVAFTPKHESARKYADFVPFDDGKYVHLTADENGVMNTLQFKFKPSLMYAHNREGYIFTFENVGSAKIVEKKDKNGNLYTTTSDKEPNYAYYTFSRSYAACPNVFGDGRLWVDCCAQPTLVDNSDLSTAGFLDENGQSTFTEQARSQMMLVVSEVPAAVTDVILDEIDSESSIGVNKEDIQASQTYDIDLQICGKYATIPDGSYVKIALGFPEGYGPDDAGVTFKLFHRRHITENGKDEYVIEEIPCVVTKFGIVATVTSFSPYMVAAVDSDKITDKTVYASIDGKGGTLSQEDGKIRSLKAGESYTYTITPDSGYQIYTVTLNGKDITSKVVGGKLTVSFEDLENNNEIEIKYIANDAVQRVIENNIVTPVKVVSNGDDVIKVGDVIETPPTLQPEEDTTTSVPDSSEVESTSPDPTTEPDETETESTSPDPTTEPDETETENTSPDPTTEPDETETENTSSVPTTAPDGAEDESTAPVPTTTPDESESTSLVLPDKSDREKNPSTSGETNLVLIGTCVLVGVLSVISIITMTIFNRKKQN